ncbi:TPA: 30S ribosomal protein S13 [Candidatus Saccharibacteria bacterium]|nr:30S ribosomal protein S13 [Candidatus Saccharibacteria bacterium]HIO87377.1 30S ribosomal protein S13 [Candidatus Saccharibacteria bacterium]
MARIAGVEVPSNKRVVISLTYVHGIGRTTSEKILNKLGIDHKTRVKDMTEAELGSIREEITANYTVEGELHRVVRANVKRLKDIGSYRGERHKKNLPVKGQRTRTNARTKRGRRMAVSGAQPKAATKT